MVSTVDWQIKKGSSFFFFLFLKLKLKFEGWDCNSLLLPRFAVLILFLQTNRQLTNIWVLSSVTDISLKCIIHIFTCLPYIIHDLCFFLQSLSPDKNYNFVILENFPRKVGGENNYEAEEASRISDHSIRFFFID